MAITMAVSRKSALKKVALWVPALFLEHNSTRLSAAAWELHRVKYPANASRQGCWQETLFGTSWSHVISYPHFCLTKLAKFDRVQFWRRLLMDLIFRLCSVLGVSWSAEKVTRCWQWLQWINKVVKTIMITAPFIILSTPKKPAEHHSKCQS